MQKKVYQLIVDNTSGVLSRISGLFSRRGYNIESITAGVTADPRFTRITIVTSGDDEILEQIEKQVAKLVDIRDIRELKPEEQRLPGTDSGKGKGGCDTKTVESLQWWTASVQRLWILRPKALLLN